MKILRDKRAIFAVITASFVTAALMIGFLSYVGKTARLRVAMQYAPPDYVRYLSQGYAFDTVSNKKNVLLTVTDGDAPVRIHILTLDCNKHTLDILELPPDSYVVADGFSGTLAQAWSTGVYREIISRVFCMKIDAMLSFTAETFGGVAEALDIRIDGGGLRRFGERSALVETGISLASDAEAYSRGDEEAVENYHRFFGLIINELMDLGPVEGFSKLMNLIVNRVDTDMTIEELIELASKSEGVNADKVNIYIAPGSAAKNNGENVWLLDPEVVAELLNESFRVKDIEYPAESLGIPKVSNGEFVFDDLPVRLSDITK